MDFCMATLAGAVRKCALNPSISSKDLLNALFAPYVEAGRIAKRGSGEEPYLFDKSRASRIMSREADVPRAFKNVWLQHGLEERVEEGCDVLFDETLDRNLFGYVEDDVLSLLDDTEARQMELKVRLLEKRGDPEAFLSCAMVGVMGFANRSTEEAVILRKDGGRLSWKVADLLRFGFHNRKRSRNIVVIPVDCRFDTHITRAYETGKTPHVSEKTVHGQWLSRMFQSGFSETGIAEMICRDLGTSNLELECYPVGTIATVSTDKASFALLATSSFDAKGVARSTPDDVRQAMESLLAYYEERGQGADIYLPLIGSGLSKSGLGKGDSLALIEDVVVNSRRFLGGKMTVAMRREDAEEMGLAG